MKTLKIVLITLCSLLLLVIAVVALFWWKPEILISERSVRSALSFAPDSIQISWTNLNIDFETLSLESKKVHIQSADLCVKFQESIDTCIDEIDVVIQFSLKDFNFVIDDITKVTLKVRHFKYLAPAKQDATGADDDDKDLSSQYFLPNLQLPHLSELLPEQFPFDKIGIVDLSIDDFVFQSGEESPLIAHAHVKKSVAGDHPLAIELNAKIQMADGLKAGIDGNISLNIQEVGLTYAGDLSVATDKFSVTTPLTLTWADDLNLSFKPEIRFSKKSYSANAQLQWTKEFLNLEVKNIRWRQQSKFGRLSLYSCALQVWLNADSGVLQFGDVDCALHFGLKKAQGPVRSLPLLVQTHLDVTESAPAVLSLDVRTVVTSHQKVLRGRISGRTQVDFAIAAFSHPDFPANIEVPDFAVSADIKIPQFQVWKRAFDRTQYSFPAPFRTLEGSLGLQAQSKLNQLTKDLNIDVKLTTNLKDEKQKLASESKAKVQVHGPLLKPESISLVVDALLQDVAIEAPPLRMQKPPQLLKDKRFISSTEKKTQAKVAPIPIEWKVNVRTKNPLVVYSNLLNDPLPINLDLALMAKKPMEGQIQIKSTPFEIFNKKARLDFLNISYTDKSKIGNLDGVIKYETSEVKVDIFLLGSTERPQVDFISDPPLNRNDILSVILYNRSLAELSDDEGASTANFSNALSDGAFGLFSLVFLSSTPIQSVSYNPATQSYMARMKIDDTTSLNVGSDFTDSQQFSIRKRLKGAWVLSTELRQQEDEPDAVSTMLEWFKRYE